MLKDNPECSILISVNGTELLTRSTDDALPASDVNEEHASLSEDSRTSRKGKFFAMSFSRKPRSDEARELTKYVMTLVDEGVEKRAGKRLSRRQKDDLELAAGAIVGDLCLSIDNGAIALIGCPKSANKFSELLIGYNNFLSVYKTLMSHDLIELVVKGSYCRFFERGKTERIRATEAFVRLARSCGVGQGTVRQHFPSTEKPAPLELRKTSSWVYRSKVRGRRMPIDKSDPVAQRLASQVEELNAFMREQVSIEGVEFTGWTRIFNQGDNRSFNWDRGARLYASPRDQSYQSLSKKDRLAILLNGEPVTEIDVRASHLTILYGQRMPEGQIFDATTAWEDPYSIADLPRSVVKAWTTITLGMGKPPTRWPKEASEQLAEEGIDVQKYSPKTVTPLILARHPALGGLDGLGWARLQWLESEAIIATMVMLQRQGIPSLPVHDSLIVQVRHEDTAKGAMIQSYMGCCKSCPILH